MMYRFEKTAFQKKRLVAIRIEYASNLRFLLRRGVYSFPEIIAERGSMARLRKRRKVQ